MRVQNIRLEAERVSSIFEQAISSKEHTQEAYSGISQTVGFIKDQTARVEDTTKLKDVIFVVGATGAGKTTLSHYLKEDGSLVINADGRLQARGQANPSLIIGEGSGSTTIFPNIWESREIKGTFIDCAGEFDSRGVIVEAINNKIRHEISSSVEKAKILFMTSQSSLSPDGAYGRNFGDSLNENAKFFKNMGHFKNSMGLVVSHAGRRNGTFEKAKELVLNILQHHANLDEHQDALQHILGQDNLRIFSKPSEEAEVGEAYSPPTWNANQRKQIIDMIKALDFTQVPPNYFHIPSSPEIREKMGRALSIVETQAVKVLRNGLERSITPKLELFTVELVPFKGFLDHLMGREVVTGLESYVRGLNYNNYLKLSGREGDFAKLNEELNFIKSFLSSVSSVSPVEGQHVPYTTNWGEKIGISAMLHDVYTETAMFIAARGNGKGIFTDIREGDSIFTKASSPHFEAINGFFKELYEEYKRNAEIKGLKSDISSKYYDDETIQVLDGEIEEEYTETEYYTVQEKDVLKRVIPVDELYETSRSFIHETEDVSVGRSLLFATATLGFGPLINKIFNDEFLLHKTERKNVMGTRKVTKEVEEEILVDRQKERDVTKTRTVQKYKDSQQKVLNLEKYNQDIESSKEIIKTFLTYISSYIEQLKEFNVNLSAKQELSQQILSSIKVEATHAAAMDTVTHDQFTLPSQELNDQWKLLEYESYLLQHPNNSLEVIGEGALFDLA